MKGLREELALLQPPCLEADIQHDVEPEETEGQAKNRESREGGKGGHEKEKKYFMGGLLCQLLMKSLAA